MTTKTLALLLFSIWLLGYQTVSNAKERPNVIIILTDDQGSIDLNSYGAKDLYTPHIDELAQSGVRFSQFYSAAPLCSPARAALLTGLSPYSAGLPNNASSTKGTKGMPTEKVTIAEYLKEYGYKTAHIGKWHLGFTPKTMPQGQGFDYSFGHMGGAIDNYSHFFYWNGSNRHDLYENSQEIWQDGSYFPDLMTRKAQDYIAENKASPFFMFYAINLPHYPVQPSSKWREHYKNLSMPRRDYAAFISTIDEKVGQLINTLEQHQIRDNTIIIFQSDHGHSMEKRAFGGGSSGIYRGAKTSLFEGGIRVPAIISYPNKIKPNQHRNQMAVSTDWLSTIFDYLNLPQPKLEGHSLKPLIQHSGKSPHKLYHWKQGLTWAVRKGNWKLIGYPNDPQNKAPLDPENDKLFLVNLRDDPKELANLSQSHPLKVQELLKDYLSWQHADISDIPSIKNEIPSIAKGVNISLEHEPNKSYYANGANSLVDERLGSREFKLGNWLGFEQDDLIATIDLGAVQHFEQITIGSLQNISSWIFPPKVIEVSWSTDGSTFTQPIQQEIELQPSDNRILIRRTNYYHENTVARYIKVKAINTAFCPSWHVGDGNKAWMFIDEISVIK